MKTTTRLTSKGQLVLPKQIRERLAWTPGTRLDVEILDDRAVRLCASSTDDDFEERLRKATGFLREGDPIADLEAEHRAEVKLDERRRS